MKLPAGTAQRIPRTAAITLVFALAAGVGYDINNTPPGYMEGATVIFSNSTSRTVPDAYMSLAPSLIASGSVIVRILMSPQSRQHIRAEGGTADYKMSLINLYNEDYPDYGDPAATLTAVSPVPRIAHRTFMAALRLLDRLLAARQAHAGVARRNRISVQVVGKTGSVSQAGSAKRTFGGLALLAVVGAAVACGFVDRRRHATVSRRRDTRNDRPVATTADWPQDGEPEARPE